jgi:hypothetical protein
MLGCFGGVFMFSGDRARCYGVLARVNFCSGDDELPTSKSCFSLEVTCVGG